MTIAYLFQIRRFHRRDLDAAACAANAACRQAYAIFGYDHPVARTRSRLMEALAEGQDFWIPEVSGVIAGVLTLRPNFIDKLFLAPQWQGLGIGSALIAKAKVCSPIMLSFTVRNRTIPPAVSTSATASSPASTAFIRPWGWLISSIAGTEGGRNGKRA